MIKSKKVQTKIKYENNGDIFISIPHVVYENTDLNYTDKIILSYFSSDSWYLNDKNGWAYTHTDTISEYLNLTRQTTNISIKKLVDLELLQQEYVTGRFRKFKSNVTKKQRNDVVSIITDTVLADDSISLAYKVTQGVLTALSLGDNNDLGGFNFNSIDEKGIIKIANRLNLSVSSVYRHLAVLSGKEYVTREYGKYMVYVNDPFVRNHTMNVVRTKQTEQAHKEAYMTEVIPPEVDVLLQEIHDSL